MTSQRSTSHPAVVFSRLRAYAWLKSATDEDFYKYIEGMAAVYAKRKYKNDGKIDKYILLKDYKKWKGA